MITKKPLIELPSFDVEATGCPSQSAVESYRRDGVVCLRNAFDFDWVKSLRSAVDIAIADGVRVGSDLVVNVSKPGEPGFFFYDMFLWKRYDFFRELSLIHI